jgi:hypothetical protein
VTSLPVQGIEPAPTHRRRKRRRRQQAAGEAVGTPGPVFAAPRRANSLPAPAVPKEGAGTNPPFEWKLDNLLVPQKKIVQRPSLTQCFGKLDFF